MPTHDDRDPDYLNGPPVDQRTGLPHGAAEPLTDRDRELARLRRRERWVDAISTPPL